MGLFPAGGLIGSVRDFAPLVRQAMSASLPLHDESFVKMQAAGAVGIESKVGVGLGWKHGVTADGVPFRNHEGGGPGFTTETRVYLAAKDTAPLGVVVLLSRWGLTMSECVLCHEICEYVRDAVGLGVLDGTISPGD